MGSEQEIIRLGIELDITPKQLASLRVKFGSDEALLRRLRRWATWKQGREAPRLLHRDSSRGYTHDPHEAMRSDPGEAVDESTLKIFRDRSRKAEADAATEMILAAEECRALIRERIEARPEYRKLGVSRSVYRITAELDRMTRNVKRRAA